MPAAPTNIPAQAAEAGAVSYTHLETEEFAAAVIRELAEEKGLHLQYMVVSEAGASVYSASKLAAEEFPQYDVNLRSAVSIARRLQDPDVYKRQGVGSVVK